MVNECVYVRVCSLSFVSVVISVSSPFVCACICVPSRGCRILRLGYRGADKFCNYAWHCDGNCHWHCDITVCIYIRSLVSLVFPVLTFRICAGLSSLFRCYLYEAA